MEGRNYFFNSFRYVALNKTWLVISEVNTTYYGYECVSGGVSVKNCKWGMKYNYTDNNEIIVTNYCNACTEGNYPDTSTRNTATEPSVMPTMFTSCAGSNTSGITNCAYMGVNSSGSQVCYACKTGYV